MTAELQNKARLVESHRQHLEELQRRMEQITGVINEHQVTEEVYQGLLICLNPSMPRLISTDASVTLNYQHDGKEEGTEIIDLGAGIFGERKWSDAASMLTSRREEFADLYETLLKQAGAIEEKLGILAQEFNEAAEKLQSATVEQEPPTPTTSEKSVVEDKPKAKPRRRAGMFGNELTLDD